MWVWSDRRRQLCSTWPLAVRRKRRWAGEVLWKHCWVSLTPFIALYSESFLSHSPLFLYHLFPLRLSLPLFLLFPLSFTLPLPPSLPPAALVVQSPPHPSLFPLSLGALYTLTTHSPHNRLRLINQKAAAKLSAVLSRDTVEGREREMLGALVRMLGSSVNSRQTHQR